MLPPSCCTVINGTAAPTQSDSADHAAPARFYRNCRLDLFCVGWARPALSKGSAHKHSAALRCPQCLPHAYAMHPHAVSQPRFVYRWGWRVEFPPTAWHRPPSQHIVGLAAALPHIYGMPHPYHAPHMPYLTIDVCAGVHNGGYCK